MAMISLIYKKGSINDPSNYRGISLLSSLGKFFYTVLKNRLTNFVRKQKILSDCQLGFQVGNRTSDAHIILYNLIRKYCHKNYKMIFGCFIDFQKAFDKIPREILLEKLLKYNITGKMYASIKNLYTNNLSCIKIDNKMTKMFPIDQGVKQGCILSPILFNLFMADLPTALDPHKGVSLDKSIKFNCIIWADDIIIMSESESDLNYHLKVLASYCGNNGLTLNTDKTKVMIFNKNRQTCKTYIFIQ